MYLILGNVNSTLLKQISLVEYSLYSRNIMNIYLKCNLSGTETDVSSVNCFHNIYHRGSRFTQLPTYLFSVVRLARGAVASFD
jgi:hypothetical protein